MRSTPRGASSHNTVPINVSFAKLHLQLTNDFDLLLMPHVFTKNVAYTTGDPRYLGTEIDCIYNCNLSEDVPDLGILTSATFKGVYDEPYRGAELGLCRAVLAPKFICS